MVRLYIIRHGDPDYDTNREKGGTLTDHGQEEAKALAPFLAQKAKITHAYSSPLYRARLTAQLGLKDIDDFCTEEKFERNCLVEDWSRELSTWRVKGMTQRNGSGKDYALWDFPPNLIRKQLDQLVHENSNENQDLDARKVNIKKGAHSEAWFGKCSEHAKYLKEYSDVCEQSDDFLERHGIRKCQYTGLYKMSKADMDDPNKRDARIAVFCHCGLGLTWLSHLLAIPLPMVYSSFWLAPSSVTTILFDEQPNRHSNIDSNIAGDDEFVYMTARALCVGGTDHMSMAGLETKNTYKEQWKRPSGIKHNFW